MRFLLEKQIVPDEVEQYSGKEKYAYIMSALQNSSDLNYKNAEEAIGNVIRSIAEDGSDPQTNDYLRYIVRLSKVAKIPRWAADTMYSILSGRGADSADVDNFIFYFKKLYAAPEQVGVPELKRVAFLSKPENISSYGITEADLKKVLKKYRVSNIKEFIARSKPGSLASLIDSLNEYVKDRSSYGSNKRDIKEIKLADYPDIKMDEREFNDTIRTYMISKKASAAKMDGWLKRINGKFRTGEELLVAILAEGGPL